MRTEFQSALHPALAANAWRPAVARPAAVSTLAFAAPVAAASATTGEMSAAVAVLSATENVAWSERIALNLSSLSASPSSVARAVRESYGRSLSARPRRFHAHA